MNGRPVAAVLFDLDGTLVEHRPVRSAIAPAPVQAVPAVGDAVRRMSEMCALGVVTDGGARRQRAKLASSGLGHLMTVVVVSGEVRAQKPAQTIFRQALTELGVDAEMTLFVGNDLLRDIGGARSAGMMTCWVSNRLRLPDSHPGPDLVVSTVAELPEVLGC